MRKVSYIVALFVMTIIPTAAYANTQVPEPTSLLLVALGVGAAGLAGWSKRK